MHEESLTLVLVQHGEVVGLGYIILYNRVRVRVRVRGGFDFPGGSFVRSARRRIYIYIYI